MRLRLAVINLLLVPLSVVWSRAEHKPLVPRPQQIRYGSNRVPVRSLKIRVTSAASPEDLFAAKTLSSCLSQRAAVQIPISRGQASSREIVLKRSGAADPLPVPDEQPGPKSREAYSLRVAPEGIEVRAASSAGLFYGVQTLCQLVEGGPGEATLPEVEINDWPSLPYRGTMVDMSHGPLPTEEEVKRQIDFLARWKANQYFFYSEASIELDGYTLLNPGARFSKSQMRRIIDYARERHIDIVPCLELYGHLHDLFRIERYADLAAVPHGSEFNPRNPQVAPMLSDWIDQLARLFQSSFFHVGMDETWELERLAKAQAGSVPPGQLYLEQFKNVSKLVSERGKRVMVWADIFTKYPETIPQVVPGTIAVPWSYGPEKDYSNFLKPFVGTRLAQLIATGVTIWDQIAPDFNLSFDNIDTFIATGRQYGIRGIINTVWSDDAQVFMRSAFPGMAYGAAAAWQTTPMDRAQFFSDYATLVYPAAAAGEVATALRSLAEAETRLQGVLGQETMLAFWADPLAQENLKNSENHREDLRQTRLLAEDAQDRLNKALSLGGDATTLSSLLVQSRMLDYAAMKFLYASEIAGFWRQMGERPKKEDLDFLLFSEITGQNHSRIEDLIDSASELREVCRAAWLDEYTGYRLGTMMGKWDGEFKYWWDLQRRLNRFSEKFHDGGALPPIESLSSGR